jgi:hypothetical protein
MNPNTPPPHDDELPDEHELAALYARLPKSEPDAALDAAVLAAALRATPARRRPRWPLALSSAAVLVLAVGMGLHLRDTPIRDPITERANQLSRPTPAAARSTAAAPTTAAPTVEARKMEAPTVEARKVEAPTVGAHPVRDAVRDTPTRPKPQYKAARQAKPTPPPMMQPAPAFAPAAPPSPPAPPAPPAPAEADQAYGYSAPAPAPAAAPIEPMPSAPAPPAAAGRAAMPAANALPLAEGALNAKMATALAPDDRVGEIRRLLDRGDRPQALRKLAELRRLYPAYDLPQDLRDLKP